MKAKKGLTLLFTSIGMLLLILDSKTALAGANSGINMCLNAIVPSLLPFFFLSILLTGSLYGLRVSVLRPLRKFLKIPEGSESLVLIGLLGGYPVGAQCISQAYENGQLPAKDAERMLAFCNNCGPAFIFGILGSFFENSWILWAVWGIQVLSALLVGGSIQDNTMANASVNGRKIPVTQALRRSIMVMAQVCGWVILFRMLIGFLDRWVGFLLPDTLKPALWGFLELTNGCFSLSNITNIGTRFILCCAMLSLGGLCVTMQTFGVVSNDISKRLYIPGKMLQCNYSVLLSSMLCTIFFDINYLSITLFSSAVILSFLIFFRVYEKNSSIFRLLRV